jgi:hypothetical protein
MSSSSAALNNSPVLVCGSHNRSHTGEQYHRDDAGSNKIRPVRPCIRANFSPDMFLHLQQVTLIQNNHELYPTD